MEINENYKSKYLKYKNKYNKLINKQHGGDINLFYVGGIGIIGLLIWLIYNKSINNKKKLTKIDYLDSYNIKNSYINTDYKTPPCSVIYQPDPVNINYSTSPNIPLILNKNISNFTPLDTPSSPILSQNQSIKPQIVSAKESNILTIEKSTDTPPESPQLSTQEETASEPTSKS